MFSALRNHGYKTPNFVCEDIKNGRVIVESPRWKGGLSYADSDKTFLRNRGSKTPNYIREEIKDRSESLCCMGGIRCVYFVVS